jgi:hypothetical protein
VLKVEAFVKLRLRLILNKNKIYIYNFGFYKKCINKFFENSPEGVLCITTPYTSQPTHLTPPNPLLCIYVRGGQGEARGPFLAHQDFFICPWKHFENINAIAFLFNSYVFYKLQCQLLLNVITLGQHFFDCINRMIKTTDCGYKVSCC